MCERPWEELRYTVMKAEARILSKFQSKYKCYCDNQKKIEE